MTGGFVRLAMALVRAPGEWHRKIQGARRVEVRHDGRRGDPFGHATDETMSRDEVDPTARTLTDPRWALLVARDPNADATFWYSVRTTGVFCRPSCRSRLPRPQNVEFHPSVAHAISAGFRPCKRCQPEREVRPDAQAVRIAELCRYIEQCDQPPSLATLAVRAGLSPFHLQRSFKHATGLSPNAYAQAVRDRRIRSQLLGSPTVTEALYDVGFQSQGRFYARVGDVLGMTPTRYRAGGKDIAVRFAVGTCSLGAVLVAASDRGVCAILLADDPDALVRDLQDRLPHATLIGGDSEFERLVAQVVGLVEVPRVAMDLPLDIRGTAFQQRVWQALREIPCGTTLSYTALAHGLGSPGAVRAVARACAANPLAVAIPCHRVVRLDGSLAGYRWGIERKRTLLAREAEP
jgi:AraC family transcriptional regulator of adaptative response/methylated-DNA-[protein]-cysteine methyltransferase